ncbi:MAG: protein O-mannosyl-transferase family, partial [Planctomycetota bacterium]
MTGWKISITSAEQSNNMQELTNKKHHLANKILSAYFAVFFTAAILYIVTCAPGPLWQDSGHYQYRIFHNDIQGTLGLALSHPLYILIGIAIKYIPFGDLAFKINLLSAIAGAVTIANIFLLVRLWTGKSVAALISTLTLAISHTFWLHTAIAEVYTLYTAFFSVELLMIFQYCRTKNIKFLYFLALLNGLAMAIHMWAILALSCYIATLLVLLTKKKVALSHLLLCILLWCIGASAYIFLIIKNMIDTGDVCSTLASAFFGNNWQSSVLNFSLSLKLIKENLILIAYNFPTPNIILFLIAFFGLKKTLQFRNFFYILLSMLILYFIFAFRYTVPDRFAFFIPFYLLVSIFIGFGVQMLVTRIEKPILYCIILILALMP